MKKEVVNRFKEKLEQLHDIAHQAIREAKESHDYNEGLVCILSETVSELDSAAMVIQKESDHEELNERAQLVRNMLNGPIRSPNTSGITFTMTQAAQNHEEMHQVILACAWDDTSSDVMLSDLKHISHSIDVLLEELDQ